MEQNEREQWRHLAGLPRQTIKEGEAETVLAAKLEVLYTKTLEKYGFTMSDHYKHPVSVDLFSGEVSAYFEDAELDAGQLGKFANSDLVDGRVMLSTTNGHILFIVFKFPKKILDSYSA